MSDSAELAQIISKRNRRRFLFAVIVWLFYGSFVLQYGPLKEFFSAESLIGSRSITYFGLLILVFLALEALYLKLRRKEDEDDQIRKGEAA